MLTRDELLLYSRAPDAPVVGWLVGGVACVAFALVGLLLRGSAFSALVAGTASTLATLALTAATQEHALARFADSLGGHATIAIVIALLLKVALLAVLDAHSAAGVLAALWCGHTLSRFAALLGKGRPFDREMGIALAWCAPPLAAAILARGLAFALLGTLLAGLAAWAMKRFAPEGDDRAGATQQVCEIAFYFGAAIG